jgi:hypothetical protein
MLSHSFAAQRLAPYLDRELPPADEAAMDEHLRNCPECAYDARRQRQLNAVLTSLPPAPPTAFPRFWFALKAQLPAPRPARSARLSPPRRFALAFAVAALGVGTLSAAAFAAESSLPDSPLYGLKRAMEQVDLHAALGSQARLQVEAQLAAERLREARIESGLGHDALAARAIHEFDALLADTDGSLDDRTLQSFQLQLDAIRGQDLAEGNQGDPRLAAQIEHTLLALSGEEASAGHGLAIGKSTVHPTPHPRPKRNDNDPQAGPRHD